jgi:DNA-binding IclR family transcriptional regulator
MRAMADWSFLTNHARALLFIAHDPEARLRDLAVGVGVTERTAYGIVDDLTRAGYVLKEKDGRRNHYSIQTHLPLRGAIVRERTIGEVLDVLLGEPSPQTESKAGTTGAVVAKARAKRAKRAGR